MFSNISPQSKTSVVKGYFSDVELTGVQFCCKPTI